MYCVCNRGIGRYVIAIFKARLYLHSNNVKVTVSVLNSSVDEALGCVRIHWRVAVLPQQKAVTFWIFSPFQFQKTAKVESRSVVYLSILILIVHISSAF